MGADPNVQDNAEWSPLHEACNRGNLSVVKVLKEFGADLNLMGFGRGNHYLTEAGAYPQLPASQCGYVVST